jgi:glycosyltransferase involved in cell wall biosynthesis
LRLALLAPTTAAAFRGETDATVGGAERQLVALADALVARGHRIDVIVNEGDSSPAESPGGARIWPRYRKRGVPLLKVFHPKLSSLKALLSEIGSDCLLQRGAADLTGIGRLASKALGIPFLFAVASESDLQPGRELVPHPQDRILYRLGAAGADLRVVQTLVQEQQARRLFGEKVIRIPSLYGPMPDSRPDKDEEERILWGGNLRPVKRPEWLLALADDLPHRRFTVFGGPAAGFESYGAAMVAEFDKRDNIEYLGRVPQERLPAIYDACSLLLNTSITEGFPNTFLEAWGKGLEIVASVDPDGRFAKGDVGRFGSTVPQLRLEIESIFTMSPSLRRRRREFAFAHLESEHSLRNVVSRWETAIAGVV